MRLPNTPGPGTVLRHTQEGSTHLDPAPSQRLRNHSPDGFQWGYSGSGPAQLALAILLDYTKDPERSQRLYQTFKNDFVRLFQDEWSLEAHLIDRFLLDQESKSHESHESHEKSDA